MWVNIGKNRYFEKWGDFEEKVERRGKGDQIVCNEPIDAYLSPSDSSIACRVKIRLSKLKISKNHPYFSVFSQGEVLVKKISKIRVNFEKFEFWMPKFDSTSNAKASRT